MGRTVVTLLLLLGGAAAALARPASAEQNVPKTVAAKQAPQQNGNCVGVVSNLGEKFTIRRTRILLFDNEINVVAVDSWHIDDLVVAKISAALGKRAMVRRIPYHKEPFGPLGTGSFAPASGSCSPRSTQAFHCGFMTAKLLRSRSEQARRATSRSGCGRFAAPIARSTSRSGRNPRATPRKTPSCARQIRELVTQGPELPLTE